MATVDNQPSEAHSIFWASILSFCTIGVGVLYDGDIIAGYLWGIFVQR